MIKFETQSDWNIDNAKKIGHARIDHDKYQWYKSWWNGDARNEATSSQINEINEVYRNVLQLFPNGVPSIKSYMQKHPEIKISNDEGNLYYSTKDTNFWIHLIARQGDYNIYIHCYLK